MLADSYSSHHEHYQPHMMPHIEPVGDRNLFQYQDLMLFYVSTVRAVVPLFMVG